MLIDIAEPDALQPAGDALPCHLFMSDVEWRQTMEPVLRLDPEHRWLVFTYERTGPAISMQDLQEMTAHIRHEISLLHGRQLAEPMQAWMTPAEAALADVGYAVDWSFPASSDERKPLDGLARWWRLYGVFVLMSLAAVIGIIFGWRPML